VNTINTLVGDVVPIILVGTHLEQVKNNTSSMPLVEKKFAKDVVGIVGVSCVGSMMNVRALRNMILDNLLKNNLCGQGVPKTVHRAFNQLRKKLKEVVVTWDEFRHFLISCGVKMRITKRIARILTQVDFNLATFFFFFFLNCLRLERLFFLINVKDWIISLLQTLSFSFKASLLWFVIYFEPIIFLIYSSFKMKRNSWRKASFGDLRANTFGLNCVMKIE